MNNLTSRMRIDVIQEMVSSFGRDIFEGVREFADANGRIPVLVWTDLDLYMRQMPTLPDPTESCGMVGGLSLAESAQVLSQKGITGVNTSGLAVDPVLPTVRNDDYATGVMAARYFLDIGYRNFGYVGIASHGYSILRQRGFCETLRQAGFEARTCASLEGLHDVQIDLQERQHFLTGLRPRTAVFCCNDIRARHIAIDCRLLGIDVPHHVAILGVDDDPVQCALAGSQLSSIRLAGRRIGYMAAQRLLRITRGEDSGPHVVEIPPVGVITRASSDTYAVEDQEVVQARRFIETNAFRNISVDDVLRVVPLGRRMLERRFRRAFGKTMHQHLRDLRIARARELLGTTEIPIKQIAAQVGYLEAFYFDRVFKKACGVSPRQFRAASRDKGGANQPAYRLSGQRDLLG